jgi:hypothetical protein
MMHRSLVAFALIVALAACGCAKKPTAPTPDPEPIPEPIPPMSRYDTLFVVLVDENTVPAVEWGVWTQDTSITVTQANPVGAIIYDTQDSLHLRLNPGWTTFIGHYGIYLDAGPSPLQPPNEHQNYPPQDSAWRIPGASVDPCKRVPRVLAFSRWSVSYEVCNGIGQCVPYRDQYAESYAIWDNQSTERWPRWPRCPAPAISGDVRPTSQPFPPYAPPATSGMAASAQSISIGQLKAKYATPTGK